jgi:hypothetical protein
VLFLIEFWGVALPCFRACPKVRRHNQELNYTAAEMLELRADKGDELLYYYALIQLAASDQDFHPDCCIVLCPLISDRRIGAGLTRTMSPIIKVFPFQAFKTVCIDAAADLFHRGRPLDEFQFFAVFPHFVLDRFAQVMAQALIGKQFVGFLNKFEIFFVDLDYILDHYFCPFNWY